jgi:glycosyltransferase involved in cell wall biosynthesis
MCGFRLGRGFSYLSTPSSKSRPLREFRSQFDYSNFLCIVKVVILHQHFNTPEKGGAIRSYYLARALTARGIQTIVITAHNKKTYERKLVEGIEVHSLPVKYDNKFGFAARSISFLRYTEKSVRLMSRFKDVTICYAISVPLTVGLAARWIKSKHKIPYLFEVGDLWPDAPIQMGFVRNYFLRRLLYRLEKSIYLGAKAIVALSPAIQSAIERKTPGRKIYLIPNMSDCHFYRPELKEQALEKKFKAAGKFVVSYIGAVGAANGLEYFLACAEECRRERPEILFMLCGDGALREELKGTADRLGLSNLTFVDFQDRDGVKDVLNITDTVFVCYKHVPILETGSPNKFFDVLAAGKLIVINFGGWIRTEIEENQCGVYVDPEQPLDFVEKIGPFVSDAARLRLFQQAARTLAERKYSRDMLGEKFAELFSEGRRQIH